eukprot:GHVO01029525.1.p1 GENE.GHVO01029525.1~~GHVO01029525.1.p1  ORF type:complete len:919 (-),score=140.75 GHVO01029525.1:91-2847(-)
MYRDNTTEYMTKCISYMQCRSGRLKLPLCVLAYETLSDIFISLGTHHRAILTRSTVIGKINRLQYIIPATLRSYWDISSQEGWMNEHASMDDTIHVEAEALFAIFNDLGSQSVVLKRSLSDLVPSLQRDLTLEAYNNIHTPYSVYSLIIHKALPSILDILPYHVKIYTPCIRNTTYQTELHMISSIIDTKEEGASWTGLLESLKCLLRAYIRHIEYQNPKSNGGEGIRSISCPPLTFAITCITMYTLYERGSTNVSHPDCPVIDDLYSHMNCVFGHHKGGGDVPLTLAKKSLELITRFNKPCPKSISGGVESRIPILTLFSSLLCLCEWTFLTYNEVVHTTTACKALMSVYMDIRTELGTFNNGVPNRRLARCREFLSIGLSRCSIKCLGGGHVNVFQEFRKMQRTTTASSRIALMQHLKWGVKDSGMLPISSDYEGAIINAFPNTWRYMIISTYGICTKRVFGAVYIKDSTMATTLHTIQNWGAVNGFESRAETGDSRSLSHRLKGIWYVVNLADEINDIFERYKEIEEENLTSILNTSNDSWWSTRYKLETKLKTYVTEMDQHMLSNISCIYRAWSNPPPSDTSIINAVRSIMDTVLEGEDNKTILGTLEQIQGVAIMSHLLSTPSLKSPNGHLKHVMSRLMSMAFPFISSPVKKIGDLMNTTHISSASRHDTSNVLFIESTNLGPIQFEVFETFRNYPIIRNVNVHVLNGLYGAGRVMPDRFSKCRVRYLVNPTGDLETSEKAVPNAYREMKSWSGSAGKVDETEDMKPLLLAALSVNDVYLYCGHQAGELYLNGDAIQRGNCIVHENQTRGSPLHSAALLMGCGSCRLRPIHRTLWQTENESPVYDYLINGVSIIIGTLRSVTDIDLDRMTRQMLRCWRRDGGRDMCLYMIQSRDACKLYHLTAAACVAIGMPP